MKLRLRVNPAAALNGDIENWTKTRGVRCPQLMHRYFRGQTVAKRLHQLGEAENRHSGDSERCCFRRFGGTEPFSRHFFSYLFCTLSSSLRQVLQPDVVQALQRCVPQQEEVDKLLAFAGDAAQLDEAEKFFLEVSKISRYAGRLRCVGR